MKPIGYLLLLFFLLVGCNQKDDDPIQCTDSGNCDDCIIINKNLYDQTTTDNYTIQDITINQDCLEITFSASGCDGDTWEIDVIDLGGIAETAVPQRDLKLKLINNEACLAVFTRTISFNLAPLQLKNYSAVNLKIADYPTVISYEYKKSAAQ